MLISEQYKGLVIALAVMGIWAVNLIFLITMDTALIKWMVIIPGILLQTFLYTGLFITAHDAMHGTVYPQNRKLNNFIGSLAVKLFALFSYNRLLTKHWEHHKHPASEDDPDFHDGKHPGFISWYSHFMVSYVTWKQLVGMAIAFNVLHYIFQLNIMNLILFWIIPSLLSTVQLFFFGTYLPHRETEADYEDEHRARSNDYSALWSFLSCYHFGYHWEHHEFPHIPWRKLPAVRKLSLKKSGDFSNPGK
jgi:beta-carotene ketolase (CrtW type)